MFAKNSKSKVATLWECIVALPDSYFNQRCKKNTTMENKLQKVVDKSYYQRNKEARKEYGRQRYLNNKEKIKQQSSIYREKNKERYSELNKNFRLNKSENLYIIYCLPNFNKFGYKSYVGMTHNTYHRMMCHKHEGNNIDEWFVLDAFKNRSLAEKAEARYHKIGHGGKVGFKK